MMVLNRAAAPGVLKTLLVEEGLGAKPDVVIPDLPKQLPRAANLGRPALPESAALQRALAPLTQEISGIEQRRKGSGLLGRLRRA
jgi:pilus assembly protein CpaE